MFLELCCFYEVGLAKPKSNVINYLRNEILETKGCSVLAKPILIPRFHKPLKPYKSRADQNAYISTVRGHSSLIYSELSIWPTHPAS